MPRHLSYRCVSDVAVGPDDNVYVLTRSPGRVVVFSPDGSFIRGWTIDMPAEPHGITVDNGRVFCTDVSSHVVRVFTTFGEQIAVLGTPGVPSDTGVDASIADVFTRTASIKRSGLPFNMPTKVAVSPDGDLYVSDGYGNARVHRFSADGQLILSWGEPGPGPGQFWVVHNVAVSQDGRVFVCDRENERVQIFDTNGRFLGQWLDLQRPAALVIGEGGHFYVCELSWRVEAGSFRRGRMRQASAGRITELDAHGRVLQHLGEIGVENVVTFGSPHGMAMDSLGNLYIADLMITPEMEPERQMVQKLLRMNS